MERNKLVEDNIGLVRYTINKYYPSLIFDEDIYQIGCIGLIEAADKFDKDRGSFSTYACLIIHSKISKYFRSMRAESRTYDRTTVSLDAIINPNDEESDMTYGETYFLNKNNGIEDHVIENIQINDVLNHLEGLSESQRKCFKAYYLNDLTQLNIAELFGISQVTVSRNIHRAENNIRNLLEVC